ncbi:Rho termination factor N-terminal domain-containing protein [Blautia faecis]|uniref:Rho termination factor N-terminal domain-containing protein n=1 Tax=Blautia faecis TaxID=871665 RepID=UPI001655D155|nr:Rho termination factor N-terminal domain-containing protein [Blautia faecis]
MTSRAAAATNTVDYSAYTIAQLKAAAKEKEIPGYSKMKKEELLEVLMNDVF